MIYLSSAKHPHLKLEVMGGSKWIMTDCLVDTGFSSGIAIPVKYESRMRSISKWQQSFELADGSTVTYELHKVTVKYKYVSKVVSAIFTQGSDALLGIEFLDGFRFLLDLKNNTVSLD